MGRGPPASLVIVFGSIVGAVAVVLGVMLASADANDRAAPMLPPHPVAGAFEPDTTRLADCSEQTCYEQAFGNIAFRTGPQAALDLFEKRIADDDRGCHRIAHTIGAAALARYRGNVARTFAEGSASCWSGYYHGVLERSLLAAQARTRGSLARIARGLCADGSVRSVPWLAFQCLHGLGHGLMISTGYDLRLSLHVCRRLGAAEDGEVCKGGVFMENVAPMTGAASRWLRDDDPLFPCAAVLVADRYECYKRATTRILAVIGFDWERVAESCASLEKRWADACFTSFGRDVSAQNDRDVSEIIRLCEVARPYGAERGCIEAAAMDIVANDAHGVRAASLCRSTSHVLRGACYRAVGTIMGRFRRTTREREADCLAVSASRSDVASCVRGARAGASHLAIR